MVRIVCDQPAAATHIARRLYHTFISDTDEPTLALLAPLADVMRAPGDVEVGKGIELMLAIATVSQRRMPGKARQEPGRLGDRSDPRGRGVRSTAGCGRPGDPPYPDGPAALLSTQCRRLARRTGLAARSTLLARANFSAWLTDPSSGLSPGHFRDLARRYGLEHAAAWLDAMAVLLSGATLTADSEAEVLAGVRAESDPGHVHRRILTRILSLPEGQVG